MSTLLFVSAPASILEQLAGVPPGTDATIKAASDAFDTVMFSDTADDATWTAAAQAYEAARAAADPMGAYELIGRHSNGLGRLQASDALLARYGLEHPGGGTDDPTAVRDILTAQRERACRRLVLGATEAQVEEMNRSLLATIDSLVGALDSGVPFGLSWG